MSIIVEVILLQKWQSVTITVMTVCVDMRAKGSVHVESEPYRVHCFIVQRGIVPHSPFMMSEDLS